jgi:proteasome lid subunit RPN8/RPN11
MMNDIRLKHGFFMLNDQGNCVVNPEFVRTDEAMEALQEDVNKVTVWCHSHVNMPCNPSTTDMTQFQEIIDNNKATGRPSVMIILNKQNTYTLYIYDDVSGERIRNPEIFIYENREDAVEGSHSIIEEMKRKLTRRPVAPAQTYTHSKWGEDLTKKNNGTSPPVHHAKTTTNGTIDFNDLAPTHYLGFVMVKFRDKKIFDDLFSILKEETASVGSDSGRRLLLRENINGIMSMMITSKTPESITRNIHAVALGLCALAFPDRLGKKPFSLSDNYSNMIEFFDFYTFEDAAEALIDAWTLVKGRTKDDLVLVMDLIFTCTIREACMTDDLWYHNLNAARLQFSRYPLQDINVPSCKTIPVAKEPEQTSLALVPPTEYPSEDAITYEENDI